MVENGFYIFFEIRLKTNELLAFTGVQVIEKPVIKEEIRV
jgi:hypothetical protein